MWKAPFAVALGSALGALLRWRLGAWLNALAPAVPPGTLAANWIGAYVVGLAIAWLGTHTELAPEWRLFLITGFCGGLTTFSTFSAEVVTLLQTARWLEALVAVALHLLGSLALVALGIATWAGAQWLARGGLSA